MRATDGGWAAGFTDAWPVVVRTMASVTGSLDEAEEYAAEAFARAAGHVEQHGPPDSLAAWCTTVARRAWIDDTRRRAVERRLLPQLADGGIGFARSGEVEVEGGDGSHGFSTAGVGLDGLDDRVALLFVACDDALSPTSRLVLALRVVCGLTVPEIAHHLGLGETATAARLTRAKKTLAQERGRFRVPEAAERERRLPVVLACVAGMFTVAHRTALQPVDALTDTGRQALSVADALVQAYPDDAEVRGLRAVVRLGLARRPGRLDGSGAALPLDEVDRSRWDRSLLAAGLADATVAATGSGRFALEAAIAGLHSSAPSFEATDWAMVVRLYGGLEHVWPAPSVTVARLAATAHGILAGALPVGSGDAAVAAADRRGALADVEARLARLAAGETRYAALDARLTLADIAWRTGRRAEAAPAYRALADEVTSDPVRLFCLRRAAT